MRTLLVTGGAGFIGGCFVRMLIDDARVRIVNFDKLTYAGNLESLEGAEQARNYVFVQCDTAGAESVAGLFDEFGPDAVFNFAAESQGERSIDRPRAFIQTN